jgi:hypothetical protein
VPNYQVFFVSFRWKKEVKDEKKGTADEGVKKDCLPIFPFFKKEQKMTKSRPLPRVTNALGEDPKTLGEGFPECNTRGRLPGKRFTGKRPSPSAKSRALGETFPECRPSIRGRINTVGTISLFLKKIPLPRVQHSGKIICFKKKKLFPKCCTRGRNL